MALRSRRASLRNSTARFIPCTGTLLFRIHIKYIVAVLYWRGKISSVFLRSNPKYILRWSGFPLENSALLPKEGLNEERRIFRSRFAYRTASPPYP
jgi:hypothetical protein